MTTTPTTSSAITWAPSREVETWLESLDVAYAIETDVPIADVNLKDSLHNQSRRATKTDPDLIQRIVTSTMVGVAIPPVVLFRRERDAIVVDGNHRVEVARQRGDTHLMAYVVQAEPEIIRFMTDAANVRHGKNVTEEERLAHALSHVAEGIAVARVAANFGYTEDRLGRLVRAEQGRAKVLLAGLSDRAVKPAALVVLNRLDVDQLRDLGPDFVRQSTKDIEGDISRIKAAPAAHQASVVAEVRGATVERARTALKPAKGTARRAGGYAQLRAALLKIREVAVPDAVTGTTPAQQEQLAALITEAEAALGSLRDRLAVRSIAS